MAKAEKTVLIGSFSFDLESEALTSDDGAKVPLRPQTARVLGMLAADPGQLVTKDALMNAVWADTHVTDDSLVQCISEIRKALGSEDGKLLVTVPKQGYRLVANAGPTVTDPKAIRPSLRLLVGIAAVVAAVAAAVWMSSEGPVPSVSTIAVLPFENISGDPDQDYLAEGMTADLITDLSILSSLSVISRTSTSAFKDMALDVREIAKELGASHVVEGSVQRAGSRLRFNASLIDAESGAQLWADRYDRGSEQILEVQDEVRENIVSALKLSLSAGELERLDKPLTTNPEAYDLYLRGLRQVSFFNEEANKKAQDLLEEATKLDASFAAAFAQLAQVYSLAIENEWNGSRVAEPLITRATGTAKRAIELDGELPMAHWSLGRIYSRSYLNENELAMEAFEKSVELDNNFADGFISLGSTQLKIGQAERALANIEKGLRLNPRPPYWYVFTLGQAQFLLTNFEAAAATFEKAIDQNPAVGWPRRWLIAASGHLDRLDDAEWQMFELESQDQPLTIDEFLRNTAIVDKGYLSLLTEGLRKAGVPES